MSSIKHECVVCRRFATAHVAAGMANLPTERLGSHQFPFCFVGVDYFGPFSVTVNRRTQKRWCFLFTCMTVRAVHLEVVSSMSTDSCLMAIFRFIARRGKPRTIWSDTERILWELIERSGNSFRPGTHRAFTVNLAIEAFPGSLTHQPLHITVVFGRN